MAELPESVWFETIGQLGARLRAREFSAVELTRACLERLNRLGPRLNALSLALPERALRAAREADDVIKRGRTRNALLGIPCGVKDLLALAGHPTTWGAKPYAGQVFNEDATVVRKLDRAGAVIAAKLAMVELAGGGGYRYPAASLTGPGLNPWDRTRWAGGSSSGSGAAVAAGLFPYAIGSETNGSILTPAAFCGVTGLRPTYGLVSRAGAMALSWTMDKIGPLARSAEDCARVLAEISGADDADPASARKRFFFSPQYTQPFAALRLGFAAADFSDRLPEPLRAPLSAAFEVFKSMGYQLTESSLPDYPYGAVSSAVIGAEGSTVFAGLIESGKVDELADARQIAGLKAGLETGARDYLHAMRLRTLMQQSLRELFAKVDLIVAPARYSVASKISDPLDRSSGARPAGAPPGFRDLVTAGNLAGLPALALPAGFAEGLPVSICLVGRPFAENTLLAAGLEFQRRTDWHRRQPPG
jgi:aspartyl-tRNA(Asn)/glutamyl-tRNA(Gln) amidotransferase subunit A